MAHAPSSKAAPAARYCERGRNLTTRNRPRTGRFSLRGVTFFPCVWFRPASAPAHQNEQLSNKPVQIFICLRLGTEQGTPEVPGFDGHTIGHKTQFTHHYCCMSCMRNRPSVVHLLAPSRLGRQPRRPVPCRTLGALEVLT